MDETKFKYFFLINVFCFGVKQLVCYKLTFLHSEEKCEMLLMF